MGGGGNMRITNADEREERQSECESENAEFSIRQHLIEDGICAKGYVTFCDGVGCTGDGVGCKGDAINRVSTGVNQY